ncbi:MAG: glycosyl hydrolase family 28-related protein [Armatimonadota bacterium]
MRHALVLMAVLATLMQALAAPAAPKWAEEFVGPFASWKNVKTDYGATGDGKTDDTAALQKALDELRFHKDFCVLYFPAGTYRITDTIKTERKSHHECMGITIVGEDPATTIIRWDGKEGGMMVKYDAWYAKISRLTLDGVGKASVALAYGDAFSTYNETSDMVFRDVAVGMAMATGGNGQAENTVLRCQFLRCSRAGIQTNNYNSLDIWAWYCHFQDCGWGMYNGAGNFHAYQCFFERSKNGDIGTANLMVFSFINNTSIGSKHFMDFASGHSWGSPTSVTGNRVIEPTGDWGIRLGNGGPYFVADNIIKARPDAKGPVAGMTWGDQTFLGNTYTVENPVQEKGKFLRIDEKIVDPKTIDVTPPVLPPTPPNRHRKVFDVPPTADAAAIQGAIDEAVKLKGQRPVVHIPKGIYQIKTTLVIPAGCDVQLVGDGASENSTVLNWAGANGGLLLKLEGPSVATVRDISLNAGQGSVILVENCDQPGAKIFGCEVNATGMSPNNKPVAGLLVNGLEEADVQMNNLQGGTYCGTWVKAVGGPRLQAGKPVKNQISVYCGATGSADAQYDVEKGGRLLVRSVYHEMSGDAPQGILLKDTGMLIIDATRFSYKTSAEKPLIEVDGFKGDFALLTNLLLPVDSKFTARFEMKGDGKDANVLCMNNIFWVNEEGVTADKVWLNTANPPAKGALLRCNMNGGVIKGGFGYLDDRGAVDNAFITRILKPLREARVWLPVEGKPGVTNVQFHRVILATGKDGVGVELRAGK